MTVPFEKVVSHLLIAAIAMATILGIFNALPEIDLATARLFCRAADMGPEQAPACRGFIASDMAAMRSIRWVLYQIPVLAALALLLRATIGRARLVPSWTTDPGACLLPVAAFLLGPILIVNGVLKSHSGRPRPGDTLDFGGPSAFVPAGDFSGDCLTNCSFVSGEAASAGWLLCLLPLVGGRLRQPLGIAILAASLLTPFLRVAMGRHYLSDALLGWLIGAASLPLAVLLLYLGRWLSGHMAAQFVRPAATAP